jgi:hypothetical protein
MSSETFKKFRARLSDFARLLTNLSGRFTVSSYYIKIYPTVFEQPAPGYYLPEYFNGYHNLSCPNPFMAVAHLSPRFHSKMPVLSPFNDTVFYFSFQDKMQHCSFMRLLLKISF